MIKLFHTIYARSCSKYLITTPNRRQNEVLNSAIPQSRARRTKQKPENRKIIQMNIQQILFCVSIVHLQEIVKK